MSPIPLGIFAVSGAGIVPSDYELISTVEPSVQVASIDFSSIPQTYRHLELRIHTKIVSGSAAQNNTIRINGSAATVYQHRRIMLSGTDTLSISANSSTGQSSAVVFSTIGGNADSSSHFSPAIVFIPDYTSTSKAKSIQGFSGWSSSVEVTRVGIYSGLWAPAGIQAVTSISVRSGVDFAAGSRVSLYGIKG